MIVKLIKILLVFCLVVFSSSHGVASENYSQRKDVQQFIAEMVKKYKFDSEELSERFAKAEKLDDVLEKIAKPAEKILTWKEYRPIFITKNRIERGVEFLSDNRELLMRAEKKYGVPVSVITAIIGVETYYGKRSGRTSIFDSLTTLGFDYPPRKKFFRNELEQFLLLSREENIDTNEARGSYAGAMGMPQFISSSYRKYAVDFDGDGKRDLWNSTADVIGSVANYLNAHGWKNGESVIHRASVTRESMDKNHLKPHTSIGEYSKRGVTLKVGLPKNTAVTLLKLEGKYGTEHWLGLKNFYVITRYNHSALYAMAVHQLAEELVAQSEQ